MGSAMPTVLPTSLAQLLAFVALSAFFGCTPAASPVHDAAPPARRAAQVYRMDYIISSKDPTAPAASSNAYTMVLEEDRSGEVMVGSNVPLSGSQARTDVGLKLHGHFVRAGEDDVMIETRIEMSSSEEAAGIHKLTAVTDAFVAPGKPTVVASLDDPASHKRYQVSVTATKVR